MEKVVNIGNKELQLRSSLLTIIAYKNTFGTDLFDDIAQLSVKETKNGVSNISTLIKVLFQIIYILHKPFTKQTFEEFVNEFDFSILSDNKALEEITNIITEVLGSVNAKSNGRKSVPTK